jgi:hypothetical protein
MRPSTAMRLDTTLELATPPWLMSVPNGFEAWRRRLQLVPRPTHAPLNCPIADGAGPM